MKLKQHHYKQHVKKNVFSNNCTLCMADQLKMHKQKIRMIKMLKKDKMDRDDFEDFIGSA